MKPPRARDPEASEPGDPIFLLRRARGRRPRPVEARRRLASEKEFLMTTPDVEKANEVVAELLRKRDKTVEHYEKLASERGAISFAALAEGDA